LSQKVSREVFECFVKKSEKTAIATEKEVNEANKVYAKVASNTIKKITDQSKYLISQVQSMKKSLTDQAQSTKKSFTTQTQSSEMIDNQRLMLQQGEKLSRI